MPDPQVQATPQIPPPPPGYQLEPEASAIPPPPAGYTLEGASPPSLHTASQSKSDEEYYQESRARGWPSGTLDEQPPDAEDIAQAPVAREAARPGTIPKPTSTPQPEQKGIPGLADVLGIGPGTHPFETYVAPAPIPPQGHGLSRIWEGRGPAKLPRTEPVIGNILQGFQENINEPLARTTERAYQAGSTGIKKAVFEPPGLSSGAAEAMQKTAASPGPLRNAEAVVGAVGGTGAATVADPRMWPFFFAGPEVSPALRAASGAGFAGQMGVGAVQQTSELGAIMDNPDIPQDKKWEMAASAVISAIMAGTGGAHLMGDFSRLPEQDQQQIRERIRTKAPELAQKMDEINGQAAAQPRGEAEIPAPPPGYRLEKPTPAEKRGLRLPRGASAAEVQGPVRGANLDTVTLDSGQVIAFDKRKVNADAVREAARTGNLWKLTGGKAPAEAVEAAKQEIAGGNAEKPPTVAQETQPGAQVAPQAETPQAQPAAKPEAPQAAASPEEVEKLALQRYKEAIEADARIAAKTGIRPDPRSAIFGVLARRGISDEHWAGIADRVLERLKAQEPGAEPQSAASAAPHPVAQPERRTDLERRKLVSEMTPEERTQALLTSDRTGLPNRRSFDEAERQPANAVAISDADGLKALNDKFGYDAGDALLKAKAEALRDVELEAYHDKGDEFLYRGESPEGLTAKLDKAREILRNRVIEVVKQDGTVLQFKGADFSHGSGQDLTAAESALKAHKSEREARGERARGELRGITQVGSEAGQEHQGAASPAGEVAPPPKGYGESNTVFTKERADKAREVLKTKSSQLSSGLDPESLKAMIDLGGYHFEAGVREFAAWSRRMVEQLGAAVRPHLERIFRAVQDKIGENPANVFYSRAERVAFDRLPASGSGRQFLETLKNGGVKDEEMKWTGLDDFLKDRGRVSKRDALDFIRENNVQVKEITKGAPTDAIREEISHLVRVANEYPPNPQRETAIERLQEINRENPGAGRNTKYSQHQLPGGENYRELLLTLPENQVTADAAKAARIKELTATREALIAQRPTVEIPTLHIEEGPDSWYAKDARGLNWGEVGKGTVSSKEEAEQYLNRYIREREENSSRERHADLERQIRNADVQLGLAKTETRNPTSFHGGHFDEPNVLAHIRFNDRVDADGKKVLFIEEVQSDWHQKGRQNGYAVPADQDTLAKAKAEKTAFVNKLAERVGVKPDPYNEQISNLLFDRMTPTENEEFNRLNDAVIAASGKAGVPDAPFKTTWHELAMKRMLRYAAENGYDKVGWTTGAQQADRYDLGRQVDSIQVHRAGENNFSIKGVKNGAQILSHSATAQELPDLIGKDLAKKIIESPVWHKPELGEPVKAWYQGELVDGKFTGTKQFHGVEGESYRVERPNGTAFYVGTQNLNPAIFEGKDLQVGGQGMKGFYDKILPDFLNKYGKKWGAKVGTANIDVRDRDLAPYLEQQDIDSLKAQPTSVHSIDITPSMKNAVLNEGQALFSTPIPQLVKAGAGVIKKGTDLYHGAVDKLLEKVHMGQSRPEIRQFDQDAADLATKMDAGGQYNKAVAEMISKKVTGPLTESFDKGDNFAERQRKNEVSRDRMKGFHFLADAQNREWLQENHPEELKRWQADQKITAALKEYKPFEEQLRDAVKQLGGKTIDEDYIKRVMDFATAGIDAPQAKTSGAGAGRDNVVSPQIDRSKARKDAGQYYWDHGVFDFGPSFEKRWLEVMSKLDEHRLAVHSMSMGTRIASGEEAPDKIFYNGQEFYRPDIAKEIREVKKRGVSSESKALADALGVSELPTPKQVRSYDFYEPLRRGSRFENAARNLASNVLAGKEDLAGQAANVYRMSQLKYALPKEIAEALNDAGREKEQGALSRKITQVIGPITQFIRQQIVGLAYGVPHMANILRKVVQAHPGAALNPVGWVDAFKVAFSKELKARGIQGVEDPTYDMLLRNAAISEGAIPDYRHYIEGNFDLKNWEGIKQGAKTATRAFRQGGRAEGKVTPFSAAAGVARLAVEPLNRFSEAGHRNLFHQGAIDQRARLWLADFLKDRYPNMDEEKIAHQVNQTLGRYNRASWTDVQKGLAPFMLFPGWDYSSMTFSLKHPFKTAIAPAILMLLANAAVRGLGGQQNRDEKYDTGAVHAGKYRVRMNLLNDNMGSHLWGWALRGASAAMEGKSRKDFAGEALKGIPGDVAGATTGTLNPLISAPIQIGANRLAPGTSQEIVKPGDLKKKGHILPNKAAEDYADFAARRFFPIIDRVTQAGSLASFAGMVRAGAGLAGVNISERKKRRR